MLISYVRGQASVILRVKVLNSSVTTGAGLTGLAFGSAGLVIGTIADNEATTTAYTQAGATIETITTLGTYAAPTALKCRFKEVDATSHPGVYEIQLANARLAVANAKSLLVSVLGATNCAQTDAVIPLVDLDPYDTVRAGLTALPPAAADAPGGMPISDAGALDLDAKLAATNEVTAARMAALTDWINGGRLDLILDIIAADVVGLDGAAMRGTDGAYTGTPPTAATIADAVWDEAATGHTDAGKAGLQLWTDIDAILIDTAEIGAAGAGLTAVPWNASWDAEVQSECADALVAYDPPTHAELTTAFTEIKGATWSSVTDTLEAIRDRGDAAWTTGAGGDATAANQTTIINTVSWLQDVIEGDKEIDDAATPWELVVKVKDTLTERVRKKLYQVDGTSVSSTDHIVGQELETAL